MLIFGGIFLYGHSSSHKSICPMYRRHTTHQAFEIHHFPEGDPCNLSPELIKYTHGSFLFNEVPGKKWLVYQWKSIFSVIKYMIIMLFHWFFSLDFWILLFFHYFPRIFPHLSRFCNWCVFSERRIWHTCHGAAMELPPFGAASSWGAEKWWMVKHQGSLPKIAPENKPPERWVPETNSSHLKIGRAPKGKACIPTIHSQVLC